MTGLSDYCVDCGRELPIDRPMYRAADSRGARCERCDALAAAGELEVARLREQAALGVVQHEVHDG